MGFANCLLWRQKTPYAPYASYGTACKPLPGRLPRPYHHLPHKAPATAPPCAERPWAKKVMRSARGSSNLFLLLAVILSLLMCAAAALRPEAFSSGLLKHGALSWLAPLCLTACSVSAKSTCTRLSLELHALTSMNNFLCLSRYARYTWCRLRAACMLQSLHSVLWQLRCKTSLSTGHLVPAGYQKRAFAACVGCCAGRARRVRMRLSLRGHGSAPIKSWDELAVHKAGLPGFSTPPSVWPGIIAWACNCI